MLQIDNSMYKLDIQVIGLKSLSDCKVLFGNNAQYT